MTEVTSNKKPPNISKNFKPLLANVPILNPLKISENLWFSGVFRGYEIGTLGRNGLMSARKIKKIWTETEAYLGPCQTSLIKPFVKTVNF